MGEQLGSQPIVRIGGTRLAANVAAKLDVVTVETDLVAPGVARLEFSDRDAELLDEIGVALGDQIEVHAAPVGEQQTLRLFTGAVYATEYCADERGGSSILIAYDAGFVLRQTRGIRSFNEVTDADLVRTICDEVGVKAGQVDATNVTHPYIAQFNETNWDFIQRRAVASDCIVYVDDGALQFRQSPSAADAPTVGDRGSRQPLQLSFGRNVTRLHARNSAAGQTGTVEVRGWDPRAKQAVEATAQPATRSAESKASPAKIGRSLGADRWVTAKSSMTTEPECASLARSVAEVTAAGFGVRRRSEHR